MAEILASLSGNDISMADSALRLGQGKILHIGRFLTQIGILYVFLSFLATSSIVDMFFDVCGGRVLQ